MSMKTTSSKYIELADRITESLDVPCGNIRLGIHEALAYLDRYPDQVPGRTIKPTITMSEVTEAAGTLHADLVTRCIEYMDLATVIPDEKPTNAENLGQAPGRTITESRAKELGYFHQIGKISHVEYAEHMGITVAPDPEPTNAEKLAQDLMQADRDGGEAYQYGYHELAEYLAERGWTKAPGGDDEQ